MFVPGKPFQPFVGKSRVKMLSGVPLYSKLLAILTNIGLG
jgi:hypothetical protein